MEVLTVQKKEVTVCIGLHQVQTRKTWGFLDYRLIYVERDVGSPYSSLQIKAGLDIISEGFLHKNYL